VQCVHLVDPNAVESIVAGLERVDQADGLAVGHGDDHVGARGDVVENRSGGEGRHGLWTDGEGPVAAEPSRRDRVGR
jgi:hypothetical protein